LRGGLNFYGYPLSPLQFIDPLGLASTKLDGKKIQVHNNDVDPWPSKPHGHIYDENQVIDKNGKIFDKSTGKEICSLSKKSLVKWTEFLGKIGKLSLVGDIVMLHDLLINEAKEGCSNGDFGMCGVLNILDDEQINPNEI